MYQLKKILLERLFELASTEYQKKYIDNATTDKYTCGDELVNEIINPLELIQRPENKYLFDNNELLAIKEYKNKLDTICKNNNTDTDLYEMPEIWNKIDRLNFILKVAENNRKYGYRNYWG